MGPFWHSDGISEVLAGEPASRAPIETPGEVATRGATPPSGQGALWDPGFLTAPPCGGPVFAPSGCGRREEKHKGRSLS